MTTAADLAALEADLASQEATADKLYADYQALQERLIAANERVQVARDKLDNAKVPAAVEARDWRWLLSIADGESDARRMAAQGMLPAGLDLYGYNPDTMMLCARVSLNRQDPDEKLDAIAATLAEVAAVSAHTKAAERYRWDVPSAAYVAVFEHTLSERGSYGLLVAPDGAQAAVVVMSYHRPSVLMAGTLVEALRYARAHHWYRDGNRY